MTTRQKIGFRVWRYRCLPLKKPCTLPQHCQCFFNRERIAHVGNVLHSFLALSPILHNELISTKREIFAPRGPGVNVIHRNKRALIEVFQRVSIRYVRSISTASISQKRSKRGEKRALFLVMNKQKLFDLKMKPSALTFNNVSAIKRELKNLLCHMAAAVWNLFSFSNLKFQFQAKSLFLADYVPRLSINFLQSWEILTRKLNKKPSKFRRHLIISKESGVWLYRDVISVLQR